MTKKNAKKSAARARQETLGGNFMHHCRVIDGSDAGRPHPMTLTGLASVNYFFP
jgi:hypothetical protein